MKFFRADIRGTVRVGLITNAAVESGVSGTDAVLLPEQFTDIVDVIQGAPRTLEVANAALSGSTAEHVRLDEHHLLSPIGRFRRDVLCTGWNYWDHFRRPRQAQRQDRRQPAAPTFFTKSPDAVIGPADRLRSIRGSRGNGLRATRGVMERRSSI